MTGLASIEGCSITRLTGDKARLNLFKCITGDFGLSFIEMLKDLIYINIYLANKVLYETFYSYKMFICLN